VGLQDAIKLVQPSIMREGFTSIPEVTWEDVGSLGHVREVLESSICRPMKFPEHYKVCNLIGFFFFFKDTELAHELLSLRQIII
jgi:SpoVK/Ycf46/Vps4 family AAA+-type ATPase